MDSFKKYLSLCWFRSNPIDLPRSVGFLKHNLLAFFVVQFLVQANMTDDPVESFYEVCLEIIITALFVLVMLYFNKSLFALVQVVTALIFCANAISFLIVPVLVWLTITEHILSYYVLIILLVWEYALMSYVIKQVLTLNWLAGSLMSLFYIMITYAGAIALGQLL